MSWLVGTLRDHPCWRSWVAYQSRSAVVEIVDEDLDVGPGHLCRRLLQDSVGQPLGERCRRFPR